MSGSKQEHASAAEKGILADIQRQVAELSVHMEKAHIADYVQLLANPRKLVWRNMVGGIARGVGIAIGLTIFTSAIVYLLKALGALNLPIVGDFIADLVEHVQYQLEARRY